MWKTWERLARNSRNNEYLVRFVWCFSEGGWSYGVISSVFKTDPDRVSNSPSKVDKSCCSRLSWPRSGSTQKHKDRCKKQRKIP